MQWQLAIKLSIAIIRCQPLGYKHQKAYNKDIVILQSCSQPRTQAQYCAWEGISAPAFFERLGTRLTCSVTVSLETWKQLYRLGCKLQLDHVGSLEQYSTIRGTMNKHIIVVSLLQIIVAVVLCHFLYAIVSIMYNRLSSLRIISVQAYCDREKLQRWSLQGCQNESLLGPGRVALIERWSH